MEGLRVSQIVKAVRGTLIAGDQNTGVTEVCTDSRKIAANSLFIPLVGEKFDGHSYIASALEAGASGCVTAREVADPIPGKFYIRVADTQEALGQLAEYYLNLYRVPVVAVTGSVGKTTTKDMVAAVLGEKYHVLKTEGNFNNNIGLPLTIFRLTREHQAAVLEMGMNHLGEIDYLTGIAHPDVALITNIGDAHIENLGCRENTLKAKSEIFHGMTAMGKAVLNGDDPLLRTLSGKLEQKITWCGHGADNDCFVTELREDWADHMECALHTPAGAWDQRIPSLGAHMAYPVTMACAVGQMFGLTNEEIRAGIEHFAPTKMRMAVLPCPNGITVLNDTYNANPQSMRAGLEILAKQPGSKKIAVLGDMLELGLRGPALHREIGAFARESGVDCLVTVGELGSCIAQGAEGMAEIYPCADQEEAKAALRKAVRPGSTILVKASRGMKFEHLASFLTELAPEIIP